VRLTHTSRADFADTGFARDFVVRRLYQGHCEGAPPRLAPALGRLCKRCSMSATTRAANSVVGLSESENFEGDPSRFRTTRERLRWQSCQNKSTTEYLSTSAQKDMKRENSILKSC